MEVMDGRVKEGVKSVKWVKFVKSVKSMKAGKFGSLPTPSQVQWY